MNIIIEESYEELSKTAADILEEEIKNKKDIILGLATGSTPIGTYKELIKRYEEKKLDFTYVSSFNLDEYVGLKEDNPNSYRYFMNKNLFELININIKNTMVPNGNAKDLVEYGRNYDTIIKNAGGIDVQILGIGTNGHIGFNEPADKLLSGTSVVELTQSTINDNSRFFESVEEIPKTAITMGIGSILKAKKIILLASGKNKYESVNKLLKETTIYTKFPASFLRAHPDVTVIIDKGAYTGKDA